MKSKTGKFIFKNFELNQDNVPFRFGTDSMLIGSWTNAQNPKKILDVGTGSGILALMMAQKYSEARITAIDIDQQAIEQSTLNFESSIYSERLKTEHISFENYISEGKYDLIISNPPYFSNDLLGDEVRKTNARHQQTLNLDTLLTKSFQMLDITGVLSVIYPFEMMSLLEDQLQSNSLYIQKYCAVSSFPNTPCIRIMLCIGRNESSYKKESLSIYSENKIYSSEYKNLTKAFYLGS